MPREAASLALDVCKSCQFVWFDPSELEAMPAAAPKPEVKSPAREVPMAARELIAEYQIKEINERTRRAGYGDEPPELWKWLPCLFGLPVEYANPPLKRFPWITWTCAALILGISIAAFEDVHGAAQRFGLIPNEVRRMGGLTLLSSFFLHGGVVHLLGNLYFLLVFGDNVEDFVGRRRFVVLLIAATLGGALLHVLADPSSTRPCVGASGGISGIIAFYAMQFPHAKLGFLFRLGLWFRWVSMRAYVALILWVLYQCLIAAMQISGVSRVSAMAHLGGAIVGLLFWQWLRTPAEVLTSGKPPTYA
jgi:membrane associated rhomboid family serine protease